MTDNEMLDAMRSLLKPINLKLEKMDNRMDNMDSRMANIESRIANIETDISNLRLEVKQRFRQKDDEIETLVTVLKGKNIMSIANHQQKSMIQQKGEQTL